MVLSYCKNIFYHNEWNLERVLHPRHCKYRHHENTFILQGVYAHDVMAAMLVSQTNPVGVQLFSYVNTFFCSNNFAWLLDT